MQLTTPSVPAIAVSTAITIFKISFQSILTMLIYNLTIYNLPFIYNFSFIADFLSHSNADALQTPPLFIEGVPVGRGRSKRSAENIYYALRL